ncbi:unnamed protein product [Owenia fusiformis]|uniref:Uncharacterized protein n=1 Tax=Owenia fusiformis TaxID=6347 RepID=A0A8J1XU70_OWEFU|nr:unnamed protein product [Owenia fusiformis]
MPIYFRITFNTVKRFGSYSIMWFLTILFMYAVVLHKFSNAYTSQTVTKVYNGETEVMIEYQEGSPGSKIILAAPHGGSFKGDFPERDFGCMSNGQCIWSHSCGAKDPNCDTSTYTDRYTMEITTGLADELETLYSGVRPHVILSHIHRSKLDPNREEDEATFGNAEITSYYNAFHSFIDTASTSVGTGCFFDIHGHTHPEAMVELGYKVIKSRLNDKNAILGYTSIKTLGNDINANGRDWTGLLNGTIGLGYFLTEQLKLSTEATVQGTTVVPSVDVPSPGTALYFSGGYDVKIHGSRYGGDVDGIQIESPSPVRNAIQGPEYIKRLAKAIKQFMDENY